jgi:KipI family sensor histidine kinase inhibitor
MNILRYGERAILLEVGSHLVADYAYAIAELDLPEVADVVPAAETILIRVHRASALGSVEFRLQGLEPSSAPQSEQRTITIGATYDGPDLADVAAETGLSVEDVVALHSGALYRVQFCGFSPGYGYLTGLDPLLQLPRRSSPRTRVPKGSIAIAGAYSTVYPSASPGGWHLIGSTETQMFDPGRYEHGESPSLLQPGLHVRFVAI